MAAFRGAAAVAALRGAALRGVGGGGGVEGGGGGGGVEAEQSQTIQPGARRKNIQWRGRMSGNKTKLSNQEQRRKSIQCRRARGGEGEERSRGEQDVDVYSVGGKQIADRRTELRTLSKSEVKARMASTPSRAARCSTCARAWGAGHEGGSGAWAGGRAEQTRCLVPLPPEAEGERVRNRVGQTCLDPPPSLCCIFACAVLCCCDVVVVQCSPP